MDKIKIKTVQPYKLYKKILKDRSKAKFALIGAVVVLLSSIVLDPDLGLVLVPLFLILSIPLTIYNPRLKAEYEPGVSYKYFRNYKNLQSKLPKALVDKEEQMRLENHQDVDFNVKVDLNAIYGVNDKLVMSYQNFGYEKEKMEDGDYLLGVSAQGVYYVCKNQTVTKTKINFSDIDTLGLLAGIGNVFVFHIISKQNDEINIIVDQNDSLLVSPFMLFSTLLKLLDDYILNGGVVATPSSRRRVVVSSGVGASSGSTSASTQDATNNNRVIDLSYSTGVLEEMRTATYVGSNRQIEIDENVTSKVVNETPYTPVVNSPSNETVSNRDIDLDDLIGSHITDAHRDNETITPLDQPVQVFQARTEIPQDETPKVENLEIETSKSSTPVIETPAVETSRNKTSQVDVSEIGTTKPEQPKKKSKTGLIIGVVAGVVAIAALAGFLGMKKKKEQQIQLAQMMDPNTYPWLRGEWRNGVYGDVLDVYSDGVKFIKNGLVVKDEDWNDEIGPLTMEALANNMPYMDKAPFEIIHEKNNDGTYQLSLQFSNPGNNYQKAMESFISLDLENQLLYYLDQSGKKVFLDKYSDLTFEEKWNNELQKAQKQLAEDLASHNYDWLYGTWIDFNGQPVVINQDFVYSDGKKEPFNLHYELEDPYSEMFDYGLYLYLCDINVEPSMRAMYWADEYSFFKYQRVSDATEQFTKVYSNAYDGFVNIRQEPQSEAPILGVLRNGPEGAVLLGTEGEWTKIDCNGIVGYVYEKYVQDTPTEVYQYWEVLRKDASAYQFTESDLYSLTAKELTYLRNSVYAKHGYIFNSQELNDYFKLFSWYSPNPNVTESILDNMERTNVNFIKNYQEQNGKTYKPQ